MSAVGDTLRLLDADGRALGALPDVPRDDLVRMFRKLASMSYGSYWSPALNAVHRTYRELRPATIEAISTILIEVYSRFGSRIIEADAQERALRKESRTLIDDGLIPRLN